jgi:hypothetical protein
MSTLASTRYSAPAGSSLVVRVEAAPVRPADGRDEVALAQEQLRPQRGDRVEQAVDARSRPDPLGLADRLQGAGVIAFGLPDPRQGRQARGQWSGVGELAAQNDALR